MKADKVVKARKVKAVRTVKADNPVKAVKPAKAVKTTKADKVLSAAVAALEDIKGRDIVVIDVRKMTPLFDQVIVVTGESARQNKALANNVQEKLKALGVTVHGVEGVDPGEWILVDLGQIVVHVMQPVIRQYYNLEELWGASGPVPIRRAGGAR
jgi:ribosome-associated protein